MMAVIAWVLCSSLSFRFLYGSCRTCSEFFFSHLSIVSHSEGLLRLLLLLIAWRLCCAISRPLCASSVWPAYLEKFYLYCLLCWLALFFGACRVYCDRMFFVILSVTLLLFIQLCVYIYIVYTPFCMRGVYMHIGSIHGILYYQFPSSAGIPSCWFSSCLVLFYPPCLVVQWVLDSFDPSSLRTRNRLFLSVAGRLGSTLFLGVVSSS